MKKIIQFSVVAVLVVAGLTGCSEGSQVAAKVNGKSIRVKDVDAAFGGKVAEQVYNIRMRALENLIEEKLLEDAAAEKKMAVEQLLKQEVDDRVTEISDEELKNIYNANKDRFGGNFDAMKGSIAENLKRGRKAALEEQFVTGLRQKAKIKIQLQEPPVSRVAVSVDDDPSKGAENAKVTIVEFSDFQCPFCGRARATVNQVLDAYKDDVKYVFRDFPLSFHQDAFKAHEAAQCANEQGKVWEYNQKLFENQRALKIADLKKYATELGLDVSAFNLCLDGNKYQTEVQKDIEDGVKAGVSGTPAFFINGIQVSGAQPFSKFKELIDKELKK